MGACHNTDHYLRRSAPHCALPRVPQRRRTNSLQEAVSGPQARKRGWFRTAHPGPKRCLGPQLRAKCVEVGGGESRAGARASGQRGGTRVFGLFSLLEDAFWRESIGATPVDVPVNLGTGGACGICQLWGSNKSQRVPPCPHISISPNNREMRSGATGGYQRGLSRAPGGWE